MSNQYWPQGLIIDDVQHPLEIVRTAQNEWERESRGNVRLLLKDTHQPGQEPPTFSQYSINVEVMGCEKLTPIGYLTYGGADRQCYPAILSNSQDIGSETGALRARTPQEFRSILSNKLNSSQVKTTLINILISEKGLTEPNQTADMIQLHYDRAVELAIAEMERLAIAIMKNKSLDSFVNAMGQYGFWADGEQVRLAELAEQLMEIPEAIELQTLYQEWDRCLFLSGEPLRLDVVEGEIIKSTDW
jgi:hypothetical protein